MGNVTIILYTDRGRSGIILTQWQLVLQIAIQGYHKSNASAENNTYEMIDIIFQKVYSCPVKWLWMSKCASMWSEGTDTSSISSSM